MKQGNHHLINFTCPGNGMYYLRPACPWSSYNYRHCRTTIKLLRSWHCTRYKQQPTSNCWLLFCFAEKLLCLHEKIQRVSDVIELIHELKNSGWPHQAPIPSTPDTAFPLQHCTPSSKQTHDSELSDETKATISLQLTPKGPRAATRPLARGLQSCRLTLLGLHSPTVLNSSGMSTGRKFTFQKEVNYLLAVWGSVTAVGPDWEHWDLLCPDVSADTLNPSRKIIQASRVWLQSKLLLSPLSPFPSQLLIPVSSSEVPLMPMQLHSDLAKD